MTEPAEQGFSVPSEFKGAKRKGSSPVGDVPGIQLDQWGRYKVQLPHWEREDSATRVTTITGTGNSNEGLRVWTERGIGEGLRLDAKLRIQLATMEAGDTARLDEILEAAKVRAGLHDARERGTALHHEWQRWAEAGCPDPGELGFAPVPELADDVMAGITKFRESGLEMIVVERLVLIDSLRVGGRLDVVVRAPNGRYRIFDWKSGADLTGSDNCAKRAQYARQESAYANSDWIKLDDGWHRMDTVYPQLDRDVAYILHVNAGVAQLYEVPIAASWREFQALAIVHRGNSSKGSPMFLSIGRPYVGKQLEAEAPSADVRTDALTQLGMVLTGETVPATAASDPVPNGPDAPNYTDEIDRELKDGEGNPLQPLASEVGAKRGCGVCGRVGHRRGSPLCLGDADPAKDPHTTMRTFDSPDGPVRRTVAEDEAAKGNPFPARPSGSDAPDYCDGECQHPVPPGLENERDADGKVTGRYVCAGCGKPATVAAVRKHVTSFSGDARPPEEQQATHVRTVQPDAIPDPPAQLQQPASKPLDWLGYLQDAQNTQVLQERVLKMQVDGQGTPELMAAATKRWRQLNEQGG